MKKLDNQKVIDILFDRYNNGVRYDIVKEREQAQAFIDRIIHE